jgi:glycosyltransferase involved in cell wall biosynthesis
MSSERLSILIVNHNRIHYLKATLDSILKNTVLPFELLIYDNASDLPDRRFLKRFERNSQVPIKVFYGEENIGVWRASNILIANAGSRETLGFIKCDNDVIVQTKGWDAKWVKTAQDVSEIGVIGANAEEISRCNSHITIWNVKGHRLLINTDYGTGVCVYWPGRTFKQLGYYEESFGSMGHGDKSIEVRCRAIGKHFVYDEDVIVNRERPGRGDHYGGYRRWKNQYVKNNKPVFLRFKEEYLLGKRPPAVWYDKYPHPEGVQLSDPTSLVNWESGVPL